MKINILAFGITKDILQCKQLELELEAMDKVSNVKNKLISQYPEFQKLSSFKLAVNSNYVADDWVLQDGDEVAIIPPVSGG